MLKPLPKHIKFIRALCESKDQNFDAVKLTVSTK